MPLRLWKPLWLVLSFLAFQGAWFACVLGAARGEPALGIAAVALVWGLQFALSPARCEDVLLTGAALVLGLVWDTTLLRTGIIAYASPGPLAGWAPLWILALWVLFATLLREPLRWLQGRWLLAAALGAVSGALSYWAAVRLGAGTISNLPLALTVLAVGWAVMTPLLTELARWLAGRPLRCGLRPAH